MTRVTVNTTVDEGLLGRVRALRVGVSDGVLLDEALRALLSAAFVEIDRSYGAYDAQPISNPDEWGDLQSWREMIGSG